MKKLKTYHYGKKRTKEVVFNKVHCLFEQSGTFKKKNPIEDNHGFSRSIISPAFAKNFIKTYIID